MSLPPSSSASACTTSPAVVALAPWRWISLVDLSSETKPLKVTKLKALMANVPLARVSWPRAPSVSRLMVTSGPASTSNWRAPWSMTMSGLPPVPAMPRLISTFKSVALAVRPSTPTRATSPALAFKVLNLRAVAVLPCGNTSVMSAKAKSTWDRERPRAFAVPPLTPAKASTPVAPMVRTSALISVAFLALVGSSLTTPSLRIKLSVFFSSAKAPATCTKPKTSMSRLALALRSRPCAPSMSMAMLLLAPVATRMALLRVVVSAPWASLVKL